MHPADDALVGTFVCEGLPRLAEGVAMVRCYGYASAVYSLPAAAANTDIQIGDIHLGAPNLVRGVLRNADGSPATGAELSLHGVNDGVEDFGPLPTTWQTLSFYAAQRQVRTDANGAFAFADVAAGKYRVSIDRAATPDAVEVIVEAGKEVPTLQLTR